MGFQTNKYGILAISMFVVLITSMGQFVASPLAPFLINEVGITKTQLGLLTSAVFFGTFASGTFSGLATDVLGEKRMILLGSGIITTFLLLFSYSHTFIFFLISSFFIGVGYSVIVTSTNRGLAVSFPANRKAFAIGMKQSGMPLGIALGASLLPAAALAFSWSRTVEWLSFFILICGVAGFLMFCKSPPGESPNKEQENLPNSISMSTYVSLLSNPKLLIALSMGMGLVIIQTVIITFTIPYFQEELFFPVISAGYFLVLFQVSGAVSRPVCGIVADNIFPRNRHFALAFLAFLTSALILALSFMSPDFSWWFIAVVAFFTGFTAMGWYGIYFAFLTEIVDPDLSGMVIGLGITFNCLGISLGSPLFGYIVDITGNYSLAYQLFACLLFVDALVFLFLLTRLKNKRQ